ncbi:MAG: class I SAM-dependent methyltransferase [Synechococcaceae cyanobacterium]|nr:class I SAM-dependent methyltransferase [Synechococcaceae cyanobacterium]
MRRWPAARAAEFRQLFHHHPLRSGERLLDVPSGGAYLHRFCPPGVVVEALEFSAGFGSGATLVDPFGPWPVAPADRVVCLAALHHIDPLAPFLERLAAAVRPGGLVHLADVGLGCPIATFLDVFVDAWTPGGHRGHYRDWSRQVWPPALLPLVVEERACPWRFRSLDEMEAFTRELFALRGEPPGALRSALAESVGWRAVTGGVELAWRLSAVDLRRIQPF